MYSLSSIVSQYSADMWSPIFFVINYMYINISESLTILYDYVLNIVW